MNFRTLDQLNQCIYNNMYKLPRDIDLIVGIPRSGMLVANIIALYLNLPLTDIDTFLNGEIYSTGNTRKLNSWVKDVSSVKKVLVIDDSISSGEAIKQAKKRIGQLKNGLKEKVIFAAIYVLPVNYKMVDIWFEICNHPRMFEWNYMHHWGLENACVDIDGVLCEDPSIIENDDGKRYLEFLKNAKPKFIPSKTVNYLVSTRLEKYRSETEKWLNKYNIKYNHLILLKCKTKKERQQTNSYGAFKAEIYKNTDCFIFIESSLEQALDICKISGKQVFCTENQKLIEPKNYQKISKVFYNDFKITIKRVVKKLLHKL